MGPLFWMNIFDEKFCRAPDPICQIDMDRNNLDQNDPPISLAKIFLFMSKITLF